MKKDYEMPAAVAHEAKSADWWRGCVIYQIYPRSFQDTTGDGIGDLKGIAQRLPYVASLGVDAIWLSPFFKSPMADMGYDVSDYCDVDPIFGTLADFDAVVAEAHRLGLKVVIDQVLSHSSDAHPWFVESSSSRDNPRSDWYVWADAKPDGTPPNNWLSVFGGPAWEWDSVRKQYYLHNFLASQPDLNFHNKQVQDALLETVRFWLDRGVDGFRLDTVNYYLHDGELRDNPPALPPSEVLATNPYGFQEHIHDKNRPDNVKFLARLRGLLDEYDARMSLGEIGDAGNALKIVADYTRGGDKLNMCYTFDLLSPQFSAGHVRKCIADFEQAVADGWVCWAFSNHDVVRHVSRWTQPGGDPGRVARFALALLISLRGSICIYQGEELGLLEAELEFEDLRDPYGIRFWPGFKGRDGARTPMPWNNDAPSGGFSTGRPWLPVPPAHQANAVSAQEVDEASILAAYREALRLRSRTPALVNGDIELLGEKGDEVLAFIRTAPGQRVFCAFNFSEEAAEVTLPASGDGFQVLSAVMEGSPAGKSSIRLPGLGWIIAKF